MKKKERQNIHLVDPSPWSITILGILLMSIVILILIVCNFVVGEIVRVEIIKIIILIITLININLLLNDKELFRVMESRKKLCKNIIIATTLIFYILDIVYFNIELKLESESIYIWFCRLDSFIISYYISLIIFERVRVYSNTLLMILLVVVMVFVVYYILDNIPEGLFGIQLQDNIPDDNDIEIKIKEATVKKISEDMVTLSSEVKDIIKNGMSNLSLSGSIGGVSMAAAKVLENAPLPPLVRVGAVIGSGLAGGLIHKGLTKDRSGGGNETSNNETSWPSGLAEDSGVDTLLDGILDINFYEYIEPFIMYSPKEEVNIEYIFDLVEVIAGLIIIVIYFLNSIIINYIFLKIDNEKWSWIVKKITFISESKKEKLIRWIINYIERMKKAREAGVVILIVIIYVILIFACYFSIQIIKYLKLIK